MERLRTSRIALCVSVITEQIMPSSDVFMLALGVAFFVAMWAYVSVCARV